MQDIKFIELFAGIGGFRYGLEVCNGNGETEKGNGETNSSLKGVQTSKQGTRPIGDTPKSDGGQKKLYTCVYANEFNKYAVQIYERNYEKPDERDIREVPTSDIPDHDLLTAGFPCQAFSIAGKRGGFEDTRGTLFFEIARIAQQKQPRLLLLENVKGLLSHDKGKTFGTILNTLDELGYDLQWQVLNSKDFGVPQNRERVFIIGHLRGTSRPEIFPIQKGNTQSIKKNGQGDDIAHTITNTDKHRGSYVRYPLKFAERNQRNIEGNYSFTVDSANTGGVTDGTKIRRLTPTECERLQGFPDGWTEGVSDTQRYKCLGNAVTTNVITAIGNKLLTTKEGE